MSRIALTVLCLLAASTPARADYYEPGAPIQGGAPLFTTPDVYDSHYCQVGDYRQGTNISAFDFDDAYDDFGYLGEVEDAVQFPGRSPVRVTLTALTTTLLSMREARPSSHAQ